MKFFGKYWRGSGLYSVSKNPTFSETMMSSRDKSRTIYHNCHKDIFTHKKVIFWMHLSVCLSVCISKLTNVFQGPDQKNKLLIWGENPDTMLDAQKLFNNLLSMILGLWLRLLKKLKNSNWVKL